MIILGIETSCDETACAVVENGITILSNVVVSSQDLQEKYGGIIPEMAAREQIVSMIPVVSEALVNGIGWMPDNDTSPDIDGIAVTIGPGLVGSLLVGVETAKVLSSVWRKPLTPVNHMIGHVYANFIDTSVKRPHFAKASKGKKVKDKKRQLKTKSFKAPRFPSLALVVSGGHTDLVLMKDDPSTSSGQSDIKWLGGTRDDAAGEAFDKTARLLGLPYPGGPAISAEAEKFFRQRRTSKFPLKMFPRPMINDDNFDWSFSGLKTAVLREVDGKQLEEEDVCRYAAEVQEAIVDVLVEKSIRAIKEYKVESFLLAGGVAANTRLTEKFEDRIKESGSGIDFRVPPPYLCTDNAAYIAAAAYYHWKPVSYNKLKTNPELTITGVL